VQRYQNIPYVGITIKEDTYTMCMYYIMEKIIWWIFETFEFKWTAVSPSNTVAGPQTLEYRTRLVGLSHGGDI
jgi:hypothetical protein